LQPRARRPAGDRCGHAAPDHRARARRDRGVTTGVLLMTYGAPRDERDVPAYLARVRGGRTPSDEVVAEIARRYRVIGGSPLVRPAILLTAHSIPRRVHDTEPGYVEQLRRTADLVARAAGLAADDWHFAFQSAGHTQEEWLRPDLVELFPGIAAGGARNIL